MYEEQSTPFHLDSFNIAIAISNHLNSAFKRPVTYFAHGNALFRNIELNDKFFWIFYYIWENIISERQFWIVLLLSVNWCMTVTLLSNRYVHNFGNYVFGLLGRRHQTLLLEIWNLFGTSKLLCTRKTQLKWNAIDEYENLNCLNWFRSSHINQLVSLSRCLDLSTLSWCYEMELHCFVQSD